MQQNSGHTCRAGRAWGADPAGRDGQQDRRASAERPLHTGPAQGFTWARSQGSRARRSLGSPLGLPERDSAPAPRAGGVLG